MLQGQPYLSELSWLRRGAGLDQAYSLVGLIHTIAPPAVRERIAASAMAPTHSWDALVCTSPAVQQSMQDMFDALASHCSARLGATDPQDLNCLSFHSLLRANAWWSRVLISRRVPPFGSVWNQRRRRAGAVGWPALVLREGVSPVHVPGHGAGRATKPTPDAFSSRWLVPRG